MVNFAELKAKAEKAKDASITKATNTRDRYTSTPSAKVNWDPNWKRAPPPPAPSTSATAGSPRASTSGPPPPPPRSRPDIIPSGAPPVVPRASRLTNLGDLSSPLPYTPHPPPTRITSGYPPHTNHRDAPQDAGTVDKIDWANLSVEDKEAFFGWLDEFFSRYLGIEVGPRKQRPAPSSVSATTLVVHGIQNARFPPTVNKATRPQV